MGTGRARGKHDVQRTPGLPDDGARRGIGETGRMGSDPSPIPGGKVHLENEITTRQRTPVPDSRAEVKDLNAHGVPPGAATFRERADSIRGANDHKIIAPEYEQAPRLTAPVPVRIVQDGRVATLRTSSHRNFAVQASTGEAVRLCGQDHNRVDLRLLNESATSAIRFAERASDLIGGHGTLLPSSMSSYLSLDTQDELWAISADSGTPAISIIQVFEQPW